MNRATLLTVLVALMVISGGVIAFLSLDGREEHLPHILPLPVTSDGITGEFIPIPNQDLEVVFINDWNLVPIPLDTPTVLDRGDLLVHPTGGGGWETKVLRTNTHLIITHESDIGQPRKLKHVVPLSDLPMDFPRDKIQTMVDGRFEVTKSGQSPISGPEVNVFFASREPIKIPYGHRTTVDIGGLTGTDPTDSVGWQTAIRRTSTHVIIMASVTASGQIRETEYPVALTDLPLDLPTEKIPVMVHGRLYATAK